MAASEPMVADVGLSWRGWWLFGTGSVVAPRERRVFLETEIK